MLIDFFNTVPMLSIVIVLLIQLQRVIYRSKMADTGSSQRPSAGLDALKEHTLAHKLDVSMWAIRGAAILFTFAYFIPIIG